MTISALDPTSPYIARHVFPWTPLLQNTNSKAITNMKWIFQHYYYFVIALGFASSSVAADFPLQELIDDVVKRCQLLRVDMDESELMRILRPESVIQMGRTTQKNYHFEKKDAAYVFYINIHLIALAKDGPLVLEALPFEAVVSTSKTVTVIRFAKSKIPNGSMVDTIRDSQKLPESPYKSVKIKVIELDSASRELRENEARVQKSDK